jgi:hypothetical protein
MTQKPNQPASPFSSSRPSGLPAAPGARPGLPASTQPQRPAPAPPATSSRFGSGLGGSRFGPSRTTWEILPVSGLIVRFSLDGLGGSLQRIIGDKAPANMGSYDSLLHSIEKNRESMKALTSNLNAAWESFELKGAMLIYPWEDERKQVILSQAHTSGTRALCLRAIDPLLVLNVLARARTNLLQPRAPLALEASYIERSLFADDSRLIKLAQLTGYIEEIIPEEAKLDEDAEE